MTRLVDLAELVRAPAALTVPGDVVAGAACAGRPLGTRTVGLAASSTLLYWAGMALNDWADREQDATERPERPVPSGRVSPGAAFGVAAGLTAASVGTAALAGGRRALGVALPLAATVWTYDLVAKRTVAGPAVMATARALDVLLGAAATGGAAGQDDQGRRTPRAARGAAALVGVHTLGVTAVSRGEVHGSSAAVPVTALAGMAATGILAGTGAVAGRRPPTPWSARAGALARTGLLCAYAATAGRPLVDAAMTPSAGRLRRAVGGGILGLVPLQGALAAGAGSTRAGLAVASALPVARALTRRVSAT